MKSLIKFWATLAGTLVSVWALVRIYDFAFANGDGRLGLISLDVLFGYLLTVVCLIAVATLSTRSRYMWVASVAASFCGILFLWLATEIICFASVRLGWSEAPRPLHSRLWPNENWLSERPPFWGDISPAFGRWRVSGRSRRQPICTGDTITLASNQFGMRDRERTIPNATKHRRVALLGDSFLEGYMVNAPQRYSNLLEAKTGYEHLNFGINGTSPIEYYLMYQDLVKRFDHDVLIINILPANDFEFHKESSKLGLLQYPIYRAFWRGESPDITLSYTLSDVRQSLASPVNYKQPLKVQQTVDSLYKSLSFMQKMLAEVQLNSYAYSFIQHKIAHGLIKTKKHPGALPPNSFAKESFENQWPAMTYSLEKLLKAAEGKEVIVIGMPINADLQAYDQNPVDDLSPRLRALCGRYGASYIGLLSAFHKLGPSQWPSMYVPCDGHFSARGEAFVANTLLAQPAYRRALGLETVRK